MEVAGPEDYHNRRLNHSLGDNNKRYFKLPYVEGLSHSIRNILKNDYNSIVFYNKKTLAPLFNRVKDKLPIDIKSNVVYKITCECGQCYIGQTKQWVKSRIKSHTYDVTKKKTSTALASHATNLGHNFDFDNVTILESEKNLEKRLLLEMIHINCNQNCVNLRTDIEGLSNIYGNILRVL